MIPAMLNFIIFESALLSLIPLTLLLGRGFVRLVELIDEFVQANT